MIRSLLLITIFMLISGCVSNLQWKQPTKDPRASFHEAYEKCLAQHPEDKSKCEEYLALMWMIRVTLGEHRNIQIGKAIIDK